MNITMILGILLCVALICGYALALKIYDLKKSLELTNGFMNEYKNQNALYQDFVNDMIKDTACRYCAKKDCRDRDCDLNDGILDIEKAVEKFMNDLPEGDDE